MRAKIMFGRVEAVFDLLYLTGTAALGTMIWLRSAAPWHRLAGAAAWLLVLGDAFHLLPRVGVIITGHRRRFQTALGWGKMVASLTMTLFYVLLWHIGLLALPIEAGGWTLVLYILAIFRIILCLLPQNRWVSAKPSIRWGVIRNVPFVGMGLMVAALFGFGAAPIPYLRWVWLAIIASFAFYLPVVLGAQDNPRLGMLMLPKTVSYVVIVALFMAAQR